MTIDHFATFLRDPARLARMREGMEVDGDRPLPPYLEQSLRERTGLSGEAPRLVWSEGDAFISVFLGPTYVELSQSTALSDALLNQLMDITALLQRAGLHVFDEQQGNWLECFKGESKWWSQVAQSSDDGRLQALDALGKGYLEKKEHAHAAAVLERALAIAPSANRLRDLSTALSGLPNPDHERRTQLCLDAYALSGWWGDHHNASIAAGQAGDREREIGYQAYAVQDENTWMAMERLLRMLDQGRKSEALAVFAEKALVTHPDEALTAYKKLGYALADQGKTKEALETARNAFAKFGDAMKNDLAWTLWRRALAIADEEPAEARSMIDEMLEVMTSVRTLLWAANFHRHHSKDEDAALRLYRQGLELAPDDGYFHGNLGGLFYRRAEHERGLEHCQKASVALPSSTWARENYANCLLEMCRVREAEDVLFAGLEAIADPTGCLHMLGHVYHDCGRFDDAVKAFEAALECQPSFTKLYYDLVKVERDRGDLEAARGYVNAALAADPKNTNTFVAALELELSALEKSGRKPSEEDSARIDSLFAEASEAHPKDHHIALLAARWAWLAGDQDDAERSLRALLEKSRYDDVGWFLLGSWLLDMGRADEAVPVLREAVVRNANIKRDRYERLGSALRACGDEEGAKQAELEGEELAMQLAKEHDALRGFDAAPACKVPTNPSTAPEPMSEERASAILEEAVMLLDAVDTRPLFRAFLEHEESGLDIAAMRERIRRLGALDPRIQGFNSLPNRVRLRGLRWGETVLEALADDVERLRSAGVKLFRRVPAFRPKQIVCETRPLRWRSLFPFGHEPDDYTIIDFADSRHQFDDFDEKLALIDEYSQAVILQGWLNDLNDFPQPLNLPAMRYAQLGGNRFTTIPSGLCGLAKLEALELRNSPLVALPDALDSLKALRYLDVRGSQLSDEQVALLREALPDCYVRRHAQGDVWERFELVDAVRDAVVHGEDEVLFKPAASEPRRVHHVRTRRLRRRLPGPLRDVLRLGDTRGTGLAA